MDIVLVVLDSLRQDHIGAYGNNWIKTPYLDKFAEESVRYTRVYPETLPTLPFRRSLYTGQRNMPWPEMGGPLASLYNFPGWGPIRWDRVPMSEHFGREGYRKFLVSSVYHQFRFNTGNFHRGYDSWEWVRGLETDDLKTGPRLSDEYLEKFLPNSHKKDRDCKNFLEKYLNNNNSNLVENETACARLFTKASQWLLDNTDAEKLFLTIESFDPHEPWHPPVHYRRLYDQDADVTDCALSVYYPIEGLLTDRELKRLQANYAGSCTMVDRWFGYFMDSLRSSGRLENTLVAVISDHGHCLGYPNDHGFVGKMGHPSMRGVNDLVLMIRHPKGYGKGTVCDKLFYNFDLTPTLFAAAGLNVPEEMSGGRDIWKAAIEPEIGGRQHISTFWGTTVTVVTDDWWYNSDVWGEEPRLFDLKKDPNLDNNLASEKAGVCKELLALAINDAGGMDKLPQNLTKYKDRWLCGLNGAFAYPYGSTKAKDLTSGTAGLEKD